MTKKFLILWISIFCFNLFSCNPSKKRDIKLSVYHWQLQTEIQTDQQLLEYPIQDLYLHLADVYWDENKQEALPRARIYIDTAHAVFKKPLIPVVYIDNQVFSKISSDSIAAFAANIARFRNEFINYFMPEDELRELQLDCDWLEKQQEKYFAFIEAIRQIAPDLKLSATIRLYPYKYYKKMGVPPVDYGVLMCYNLGRIKNPETVSSILDEEELALYLKNVSYPLSVKPALPVFGWYVWFRNQEYKRILYLPKELEKDSLLKRENLNNFTILKDTVIDDIYFRSGDVLRNEYPSIGTLNTSMDLLKKYLPKVDEVILYHWNEKLFKQYEEFINSFRSMD